MTLQEIADYLNGKIIGDSGLVIDGISEINKSRPGTITFLGNLKYKTHINNNKYSSDRILGVLITSKNNKSMISKIDKIENDLIIADNENKDRKF